VTRKHETPGAGLLGAWSRLSRLPLGERIFSWYVGRIAPYSGSMGAVVRALEPGYARITLRDRHKVRNHLASVHALALANLGELTTGLAMVTALRAGTRGIPVRLTIAYHKKARGTITAECRCGAIPPATVDGEHTAVAELRDAAGDVVAELSALWHLGPA
jgi:acyl-coenzyme A thioesterase PaaI-like protein